VACVIRLTTRNSLILRTDFDMPYTAPQDAGSPPNGWTQDHALRCVLVLNIAAAEYYWQYGASSYASTNRAVQKETRLTREVRT
jgi:hypothetical protein